MNAGIHFPKVLIFLLIHASVYGGVIKKPARNFPQSNAVKTTGFIENKGPTFAKAMVDKASQIRSGFIENKGQVIDQNQRPNNEVLFLYNGKGLHVQLKKNGFSYEVVKGTADKPHMVSGMNDAIVNADHPEPVCDTLKIHRIDILFDGMVNEAELMRGEQSADYINDYTGLAPITHIHHYQKIIYKNVYTNIDVEFVIADQQFKYNFIIHPGGKVGDIKLKFEGANNITLSDEGHIVIETAYGVIDESIPYSYLSASARATEDKPIEARFISLGVKDQQRSVTLFGIEVENYDTTKTLVIDPLPWATYFGGDNADYAYCTSLDTNGNIFIGGLTSSGNIATSGASQNAAGGNNDGYIAKFNSSGSLLWCTYIGGAQNDYIYDLVANAAGDVYACGFTSSTTNIATSGAYQGAFAGTYDALIIKFNSAGILQWGTYFGGALSENLYTCTADRSGNLLVAGSSGSLSGIASSGAYQTVNAGGVYDVYLAKFNPLGQLLWATYYGGTGDDYVQGVITNLNGDITISGRTSSANGIATSGAWQPVTGGGGNDAFVAKFNAAGAMQWATYFGAAGNDIAYNITTDTNANLIITGNTNSTIGIANLFWRNFAGNRNRHYHRFGQ